MGSRTLPAASEARRSARKLAARQDGLLSRRQALAVGLSPRAIEGLLGSAVLRLELPKVYSVVGAPRDLHQRMFAACLRAGEGAAISHRAAALLWELPDSTGPEIIELTSPRRLRDARVVTHRGRLARRDVTRIGPITVTDPTRTLLDLGAVEPPAAVRKALDEALGAG